MISGLAVTVKAAHVRLCHSRMMFARAYLRESQEMVSTPMTMPLPSSRAPARGASVTVRLGRHRFEAIPDEGGGGGNLHGL